MPEEKSADINNNTENIFPRGEDSSSPVDPCSAKNEALKNARPLHIVFDVVDSVKGGSGKSTISLQLAAFWLSQPKFNVKTSAYIIDLDLRGTSWRRNYDSLLGSEEALGKKYINRQLMYDFSPEDGVFWTLPATIKKIGEKEENIVVPICICDPEATGDITSVKSDLLESTVYKIIKRIITRASKDEEVHIIFDMPPSYEAHAERVFTHLLMDKGSELFKELQNKELYSFNINLLMLFAISRAHLEQNVVYVRNLLKSPGYSSNMLPLATGGQFSLYFIGNDVTGALNDEDLKIMRKKLQYLFGHPISADEEKTLSDKEKKLFEEGRSLYQDTLPPSYTTLWDVLYQSTAVIKHFKGAGCDFEYFIKPKDERKPPILQPDIVQIFGDIFIH